MSINPSFFDKTMRRVNFYLSLTGLDIAEKNNFRTRWFCFLNFASVNVDVVCEIIWFIKQIATGIDLIEATYIIPCVGLCILGDTKGYFLLINMDNVLELIKILKDLFRSHVNSAPEDTSSMLMEIRKLHLVEKVLLCINASGAAAFAIGPFVILASRYYATGEVKLLLPFLVSYPFDYTDVRFYPFAYLKQLWSTWVAIFNVFSPDLFYYSCCVSITLQFRILQYDIERMVVKNWTHRKESDLELNAQFLKIIHRHKQLIRCVDLLEKISSKSNLMNVLMSSFLICATGFNIMAIDNLPLMAPFISFLLLSIFQIFIFCYYGDMVMRSSTDLSKAVFSCKWYNSNLSARKNFLFVLTRTQKPCIITAYNFTIIHLRAFTKILSTAWSYFALLTTLYRK